MKKKWVLIESIVLVFLIILIFFVLNLNNVEKQKGQLHNKFESNDKAAITNQNEATNENNANPVSFENKLEKKNVVSSGGGGSGSAYSGQLNEQKIIIPDSEKEYTNEIIEKEGVLTSGVNQSETLKMVVSALLRYSKVSDSFTNVNSLTNEQKQALNNSLKNLENNSFIIYNDELKIGLHPLK